MVSNIFSISINVLRRLLHHGRQKLSLFGEELIRTVI